MEVREPPRAVREQPAHLRKERARWQEQPAHSRNERAQLRGEPVRWQEQPTGLGTGSRPEAAGLGRGASASPPWIAARCAH